MECCCCFADGDLYGVAWTERAKVGSRYADEVTDTRERWCVEDAVCDCAAGWIVERR